MSSVATTLLPTPGKDLRMVASRCSVFCPGSASSGPARRSVNWSSWCSASAIWRLTNGLELDDRPLNAPTRVVRHAGAMTVEFDGGGVRRFGGGIGRLFKIDKLPINTQLQAFYNVLRPTNAASWTLRCEAAPIRR